MRAGKLRERVTIEEPVETQNAVGTPVRAWQTVATVWAEVLTLKSGRGEFFESGQRNAELTHQVTIRARAGLTPKMRAVFKGAVLNIQRIVDAENRGRELQLFCAELVGRDAA